jgi:hypothetical protein
MSTFNHYHSEKNNMLGWRERPDMMAMLHEQHERISR